MKHNRTTTVQKEKTDHPGYHTRQVSQLEAALQRQEEKNQRQEEKNQRQKEKIAELQQQSKQDKAERNQIKAERNQMLKELHEAKMRADELQAIHDADKAVLDLIAQAIGTDINGNLVSDISKLSMSTISARIFTENVIRDPHKILRLTRLKWRIFRRLFKKFVKHIKKHNIDLAHFTEDSARSQDSGNQCHLTIKELFLVIPS